MLAHALDIYLADTVVKKKSCKNSYLGQKTSKNKTDTILENYLPFSNYSPYFSVSKSVFKKSW